MPHRRRTDRQQQQASVRIRKRSGSSQGGAAASSRLLRPLHFPVPAAAHVASAARRVRQSGSQSVRMADSASELQAAASLFGSFCVDANLAFYEQKKKDPHPLACEAASKDVKACWDSL